MGLALLVCLVLAVCVAADPQPGWTTRSLPLDTSFLASRTPKLPRRQAWHLTQPGTTGVAAMQLTVVSSTQLLIVDKVERNPLRINGHSAWSALYDLRTNTVRPVDLQTNSFCAGGGWLSNGTLVVLGGNDVLDPDIGDKNGAQGLRLFTPSQCSDSARQCAFFESPQRVRLASRRWYPSVVHLDDGALFIIGGSTAGVFENSPAFNVPTYEFWPPRNVVGADGKQHNGTPIPSPFLRNTLNANLFPIAILLPAGRIFIAANQKAIMYDYHLDIEIALPNIPNGVRVSYPMAGTGLLLPLTPDNGYTPTILLCGGSASSDSANPGTQSTQDVASAQCARLEISIAGIRAGWQVEQMPGPRVMPDAVLMPDGKVLIVNGARTGYSGYGNVRGQVGVSNADNPVQLPVLYDPAARVGTRFTSAGLPGSRIPRMYHSVASVLPSGAIVIAGSNPNNDVVTNVKFSTEYRLEILFPPYITMSRPVFVGLPARATWGQIVSLVVRLPPGTTQVQAALMDFGYSTHALHMNQRHVFLHAVQSSNTTLLITMPPNPTIFPPGPAWLFLLANGVPSEGQQLLIGSGVGPRVDTGAWLK
ncbi:hypothetical protein EXIGLDRAFT_603030 [Exidia glandulosa HHB12029]|uniref:Glyoxal oxidase n=1 Tax=Exidia glandulosa HHB12029 TaxID=1314781 RepID=A0A165NYM5_EXIGL|nr:hypothetical protein EXIGLDRAFT_603030 [Exidia glandulosa HHB12029]